MVCDVLALDGRQVAARIEPDGCCVPDVCQIDFCGLVCNFISQLPRGPLWDAAKFQALEKYRAANSPVGCSTYDCQASTCVSLVDHAIYTARRLHWLLLDALAPALREANPATAYDTLDDWLVRLGWSDCFDTACRSPDLGATTPVEIIVLDGLCDRRVFSPPAYPDDLTIAVKHGIVLALQRLSNGIVRNLDNINGVLAPLGAKLEPVCWSWLELDPRYCAGLGQTLADCDDVADYPCSTVTPDPWECPSTATCEGHDTLGASCTMRMKQFKLQIVPTAQTLPAHVRYGCAASELAPISRDIDGCSPTTLPTVQAYYDTKPTDPVGLPPRIWPGLLAAECIARSLLPTGKTVLVRGY